MKKLYAFFLLLPLLCAVAAAQPKWGENLVENPGFSDGMTGWSRNSDYIDEGCYPYGAVVSDDVGGKSAGDSCLAFSYYRGAFAQSIKLYEHGFGEADLDGALLAVSVDAYYMSYGAEAETFSASFLCFSTLDGVADTISLVPDTAFGGLLSWTTFSDTVRLPSRTDVVDVTLSGCSSKGWWGYYGPRFDNVSVRVIRGGATALPTSPAVASDASAPLFDLQGRRVASPVRGRPYVQGGRLKVAR